MNVNLDVLELIFAQLDGADLVAAALASRAFLAGAIPSLYARIEYTARHAKHAHDVASPFAALAAHGHLAVHVRRIAVHAAPVFQLSSNQVSPAFLKDLAHALRTATNLRSFVCTVKILPPLLPPLLDNHRLSHLRICATLGSRQITVLQNLAGIHSLSLDYPSWTVIDVLPRWSVDLQRTLVHLTLFMSQDVDAAVLTTILAQLPRLRGLHVIGCPRITHINVLRALNHTPDLHELSLTVFPSQETVLPPLNFPIPPLTHLSIDVRASHPGLKSLIARIISRLSPRDALAICGGWIGEIKASSERNHAGATDAPGDLGGADALGAGAGAGQNFHILQGHVHLHGPMPIHAHGHGHGHQHGNDQAIDLPLLTPPILHHGNAIPNQNAGAHPPVPGNQAPLLGFFGFPFPFPLANGNNDDDDPPGTGPMDAPNPDLNPDPNLTSLIPSLPSTLSVLHLPQISPAGLKEVVERCEGIRLLGIVIGNAFATPASIVKTIKTQSRSNKPHTPRTAGVRPEIRTLAAILSRARVLRELIMDTTSADISGNNTGPDSDSGTGGLQAALLTPPAVRMLMLESPILRRIVGEGRVWESCTPTPSSPVPSPRCLAIELSLSKARYGPGAGNHAHGPPGFGTHRGGYGQVEASNDHWFWLTESASGGKVYSGF